MLKILKNPFYIYPFSFGLVFTLYSFNWSTAFPALGLTTIIFFVSTFLISIIFGLYIDQSKFVEYTKIVQEKPKMFNVKWAIVFILVGVCLEIIVEGGSPFIAAVKGEHGVKYDNFGIKSFHVLLTSFNAFLIVYIFHLFLSTKKRKYLLFYALTYIPPLLIFSRGMIMAGIISSFFVFILSMYKTIKIKMIVSLLISGLIILYIFGILGNLRAANGDDTYIPTISGATNKFLTSKIPNEFYWTYLYGASPLANFQENIDKTQEVDYNVLKLLVTEISPDVISKRLVSIMGFELTETFKIRHWLTVGTVYSRSYSYAKWLGPILLFLYFIFSTLIIIGLVPKKSEYHVSAMALISTIIFLNTFDNMFVFSGLILPLIYPIILTYLKKKKFIIK